MKLVCMLTARITPNQTRSMPSFCATGASSGMMMKASSKKSRKKARKNTSTLTKTRKPTSPPGSEIEQVLDPLVAVDAIEGERKDARADEDEHHERGQLRRRFRGAAHDAEVEARGVAVGDALCTGEQHGAYRAHGSALGRRGDADEDRAEHEEDEQQRRHHHEDDLLGERRQERRAADALQDCAQGRDEEREPDADREHEDDEVGAASRARCAW